MRPCAADSTRSCPPVWARSAEIIIHFYAFCLFSFHFDNQSTTLLYPKETPTQIFVPPLELSSSGLVIAHGEPEKHGFAPPINAAMSVIDFCQRMIINKDMQDAKCRPCTILPPRLLIGAEYGAAPNGVAHRYVCGDSSRV
jgi:hypothetical protein